MDALLNLLPSILAGAACGLIAWGGMRIELRYLSSDVKRAHKRLDLVGAPNVTLDV